MTFGIIFSLSSILWPSLTYTATVPFWISVVCSISLLTDIQVMSTFILLLEKEMQPTPVLLPGEPQGQRSLMGYCLQGRSESDTTEATQQQQRAAFR